MSRPYILAFATLIASQGCGESRERSPGTLADAAVRDAAVADAGTELDTGVECGADSPKAQPVGAPCCPGHGLDACSLDLFCEAFDGRTQPVCYRTGSRAALEECRANEHCRSRACHPIRELCAGEEGDPCATADDCLGLECTRGACEAPPACAANPNNCAVHELMTAAPDCACLQLCESGYSWNPATYGCDPA